MFKNRQSFDMAVGWFSFFLFHLSASDNYLPKNLDCLKENWFICLLMNCWHNTSGTTITPSQSKTPLGALGKCVTIMLL